jgi:hypothetical protein
MHVFSSMFYRSSIKIAILKVKMFTLGTLVKIFPEPTARSAVRGY